MDLSYVVSLHLNQGWQIVPEQDQIVNYFRLLGPNHLLCNDSTMLCHVKAAINNEPVSPIKL